MTSKLTKVNLFSLQWSTEWHEIVKIVASVKFRRVVSKTEPNEQNNVAKFAANLLRMIF